MIFGKQIIICLFYHGSFTINDVHMTHLALLAMAFGLPAFMLNRLLYTIFYAHKSIKKPTIIACICAFTSIGLNLFLVPLYKHVGIALTSSISAWIQCLALFYMASKHSWIKFAQIAYFKWLLSFVASLTTLCFIKYLSPHTSWWLEHATILRFEMLMFISVLFLISFILQLRSIGLNKQLQL